MHPGITLGTSVAMLTDPLSLRASLPPSVVGVSVATNESHRATSETVAGGSGGMGRRQGARGLRPSSARPALTPTSRVGQVSQMVIATTDVMDVMETCLAAARRAIRVPTFPGRLMSVVSVPAGVAQNCAVVAPVAGRTQCVAHPRGASQVGGSASRAASRARVVMPIPLTVLSAASCALPAHIHDHEATSLRMPIPVKSVS